MTLSRTIQLFGASLIYFPYVMYERIKILRKHFCNHIIIYNYYANLLSTNMNKISWLILSTKIDRRHLNRTFCTLVILKFRNNTLK